MIDLFDYKLPDDLISHNPIEPRDSCRLLLLNKRDATISHHVFTDLVDLLGENDVLVINDTKVFPARLFGKKASGGKAELLLLKHINSSSFTAIGKGSLKIDNTIIFNDTLAAKVVSKTEDGELILEFNHSGADLIALIDRLGETPLPPYIHTQEKEVSVRSKYQTVYAKNRGSAAAPTAGMHFTPELLRALESSGVQIEKVTLHVGLGTFRPVTDEQIQTHTLHSEYFSVNRTTADRLNKAKKAGKRIIAVGTTTCRLLETLSVSGSLSAGEGETSIFIQPGHKFRFVDSLITNFHLPKTSLLMLVTALVSYPNSPTPFSNFKDSSVGKAYSEAIKEKYKFFSFGDAMIIH